MNQINEIVEIPIYDVSTMSFKKETINKLAIPKSDFANYMDIFAIRISGWEKYMKPKYQLNDIVILEKSDDYNNANGKDCVVQVKNSYSFRKVIIQNDILMLSVYDNNIKSDLSTEPVLTYSIDQIHDLPIKIIGIAREKRTRL